MVETPSSTNAVPLVRARFCQEWMGQASLLGDPWKERFLARIPPEVRTDIEGSSRVAWVPMRYHVVLAEAMLESCGEQRAHLYYRRAFATSLDGPILGPLFRTGARVLGISMSTIVRWAPKGWDAGMKNAGTMFGEVLGPGRARIRYVDLPPVCTASDAWLKSASGTAYGALDLLRLEGIVRLDLSERAHGKMTTVLEWSERA